MRSTIPLVLLISICVTSHSQEDDCSYERAIPYTYYRLRTHSHGSHDQVKETRHYLVKGEFLWIKNERSDTFQCSDLTYLEDSISLNAHDLLVEAIDNIEISAMTRELQSQGKIFESWIINKDLKPAYYRHERDFGTYQIFEPHIRKYIKDRVVDFQATDPSKHGWTLAFMLQLKIRE